MIILFNSALIGFYIINRTVQNVLFGPLTGYESEKLKSNLLYTIMEFFLAFVIIQEPITIRCLGTLGLLLSLKWFHKLSEVRVSYMMMSSNNEPYCSNWRLLIAMGGLHLTDIQWIRYYFQLIMVQKDFSMLNIIFALESSILYNTLLATTGHYMLAMVLKKNNNNLVLWHWANSYLTLIFDLTRLGLYFYFSCILLTHYCIPLHLFRETYLSLRSSIAKLRHAIWFKKSINKGLEPLNDSDSNYDICIICRDSLSSPTNNNYHQIIRISKCGHTLHENCLLDWLEITSSCPTCRCRL